MCNGARLTRGCNGLTLEPSYMPTLYHTLWGAADKLPNVINVPINNKLNRSRGNHLVTKAGWTLLPSAHLAGHDPKCADQYALEQKERRKIAPK
jgi:hypothetical protein